MRILKYLALVLWLTTGAAEVPSDDVAGIGVAWVWKGKASL
jgi:hypothetical protein